MFLIKSIQESWFYHLCAAAAAWFSRQWQKSAVVTWFSSQSAAPGASSRSLFARLFDALHHGLAWLFHLLRLDRLLQGSIFCIPVLWCGLAVAGLPFLSTMQTLALVMLAFLSLLLTFGRDRERSLVYFPANKFIYLFAVVYLYAAATSTDPGSSLLVSLLTAAFVLFSIVLTNSVTRWNQVKAILAVITLGGLLVSLYGFYQFLHAQNFVSVWTDTDLFSTFSFRVYSTFANPNVLGEYFLLTLPLAAALLLTAKKWPARILWLVCCGAMLLCLALTYSRGCYLGLMAAAALFLIMLDRRFILVGVVALLLAPFLLPESILERFLSIGNMEDTSTSYRWSIWMGVLDMLKDYWFSGVGPGETAFNMVYPAYAYHDIAAPHSHNLFLQITCDAGVCGILMFVFLGFSYYRSMFTAFRHETDKEVRIFQMAGLASISGFVVQSMTDYTFYNYRVMLLFWTVLALSLLFAKGRELKGAERLG